VVERQLQIIRDDLEAQLSRLGARRFFPCLIEENGSNRRAMSIVAERIDRQPCCAIAR
jgi:hypothetical protein